MRSALRRAMGKTRGRALTLSVMASGLAGLAAITAFLVARRFRQTGDHARDGQADSPEQLLVEEAIIEEIAGAGSAR
jgi:hypothetical protein